ncbi:hypothetical protein GCM10010439_73200 [Actinocorallia aurantiaca]|uniref:Uncharacterized protein n=1 Tax=Actinocorallia aurantiaca TaxID=46204 RepID=A0ABN3UUB9_9ACTN
MPPTIAAISPASTGAPEATAIPSDNGIATRKTTNEAGTSRPGARKRFTTACGSKVTLRIESQAEGHRGSNQ